MQNIIKNFYLAFMIVLLAFSAAAAEEHLKFAVIADVRVEAIDDALEFIASQDVDFILLPGDFCYDGQDYYPHFLKYGFDVSPQYGAEQQKIYFVLGNHDFAPSGGTVFQDLISPFYPDNGPASAPAGTIFSFDRGNCHFVITNQYWNYPHGGYTQEQLDWIEEDLAGCDRPFKFIAGHEPAFPRKRHVGDSLDADPAMRDAFWEILTTNGVQAYFCGHSHNLSHVLYKGVYQFDAGQVRNNHICMTIVELNDEKATVRSYEKKGTYFVSVVHSDGNEYSSGQTILPSEGETGSDEVKVLFEGSSPESKSGCFIDSIGFFQGIPQKPLTREEKDYEKKIRFNTHY